LIFAICRRAFGPQVEVPETRELGGGTFNTTYLISLPGQQVILRIAPPESADLAWHEHSLMRREHTIKPYFAALNPLMPRTLLVDFTHQLVDRDYMLQTYLHGERWDDIAGELDHAEQLQLWEQFGRITRTIHDTAGTVFGGPPPAQTFATWSAAVLAHLDHAVAALHTAQLGATDMDVILEIARSHAGILDQVRQPHLLHGDLWLFNLLVAHTLNGPRITGVLDADRAWWGDPLADWTMFLLAKTATPETEAFYAGFWQAYGRPDPTPETRFRQAVYEAMHVATAMAWAARQSDDDTLTRGRSDLQQLVTLLRCWPQ
jgi:aminoglycoside phosphotransferase (APT) family kinase protein